MRPQIPKPYRRSRGHDEKRAGRDDGIAEPSTPLETAMWDSDPANVEWKKHELERARQLAEWGNAHALAEDARDLRP